MSSDALSQLDKGFLKNNILSLPIGQMKLKGANENLFGNRRAVSFRTYLLVVVCLLEVALYTKNKQNKITCKRFFQAE